MKNPAFDVILLDFGIGARVRVIKDTDGDCPELEGKEGVIVTSFEGGSYTWGVDFGSILQGTHPMGVLPDWTGRWFAEKDLELIF